MFWILNEYLSCIPWAEGVHKCNYILHCVSYQGCVCHVDRNVSVIESVFW